MSILQPFTQLSIPAGRAAFTTFLGLFSTRSKANAVTLKVVTAMNKEMARKRIDMTDAHRKAAEESILRGDNINQFLLSENRHVLNSAGTGFVYHTGKYFHSYVVPHFNKCPKSKT